MDFRVNSAANIGVKSIPLRLRSGEVNVGEIGRVRSGDAKRRGGNGKIYAFQKTAIPEGLRGNIGNAFSKMRLFDLKSIDDPRNDLSFL